MRAEVFTVELARCEVIIKQPHPLTAKGSGPLQGTSKQTLASKQTRCTYMYVGMAAKEQNQGNLIP